MLVALNGYKSIIGKRCSPASGSNFLITEGIHWSSIL
jgi:hypothetical protein